MISTAVVGDATIVVDADTNPLERGLGDGATKGATKAGSIIKGIIGAQILAVGARAGVDFLKGTIDAAREANAVAAQTSAVIKSTGGAAGVSAKQVNQLADSIARKTGIDDEQIAKASNLLLTFCLEDTVQALAKGRGWVPHTELAAGEEILAYDAESDSVRWEPIESMHRFDVDEELIRWDSKQIDVATTKAHRWWSDGRSGVGPSSERSGFVTTEEVSGHQVRVRIGGGFPESFAGEAKYSDDLVELAGWVFTEGWFPKWKKQASRARATVRQCGCGNAARNARGPARCDSCGAKPIQAGRTRPLPKVTAESNRLNTVGFCQSETANPVEVKRIRGLVGRLRLAGHRVSETSYVAAYNGSTMIEWHFGFDLGRAVRSMLPDKKLSMALIESMTREQADMFLDVLVRADGSVDKNGHAQFIQKDSEQLAVVAALAAMLGKRTTILGRGDSIYFPTTNHLWGHRTNATPEAYKGTVWCPHLRTGLFYARNRGRTFITGNTNVRNEVGKGNDIFNQATQIAADMGTAFGTDAAGSAIQLGKALNDPIKGISALSRVGVTFTDQQKKQIEQMVKVGDTAGAQKVILAELSKEFGGSAEAQATAAGKLKVTIGNIKEDLGNKLIPIVDRAATFLAEKLPGAIDTVGAAFGKIKAFIEPVIATIQNLVANLSAGFSGEGSEFISGLDESFYNFGQTLKDLYENAFKPFVAFLQDNFKSVLAGVAAAVILFAGPFVALGLAFAIAYAKSETFRDIVQGVVESVSGFVQGLVEFVQANLPKFQESFERVANAVVAIFNQFKGTLLPIITAVIDTAIQIIGRIVDTIKQMVLFVTNIINGDFSAAFGNLKRIVGNVIGAALDLIKGLVPAIAGLIVGVVSAMASFGGDIIKGLVRGIKDKAGEVLSALKNFVLDKIPKFVKGFFGISSPSKMFAGFGKNMMEGLAGGIRSASGAPLDALGAVSASLAGGSSAGSVALTGAGARGAGAGVGRSVDVGGIHIYEVESNPQATAFAVMSRIAQGLNL